MWEAQLRGLRADKSFMVQWIHRLMFYDLPEWVFTTAYVIFALAVAATFWLAPPMRHRAR
jgi:hypothetical protein